MYDGDLQLTLVQPITPGNESSTALIYDVDEKGAVVGSVPTLSC